MTLTPTQIDASAQLLKKVRLEKSVIANIPLEIRPQNLKEAYRVQDRLIEIQRHNPLKGAHSKAPQA